MLLVLQVPMADLRCFDKAAASPAVGPLWKLPPDPQRREFVRGAGGLRKLADGVTGLDEWPTEAWYVDARRALRFPHLTEADFAKSAQAAGQRVFPLRAFRRICGDGNGLWHMQVGIELNLAAPSGQDQLRTLVDDFLAVPVQFRLQGALERPAAAQRWLPAVTLRDLRTPAATAIQASTTPRAQLSAARPVPRVRSGTPLIYLETQRRQRLADPDPRTFMQASQTLDESVSDRGVPLQMHYGAWPPPSGDHAVLVWVEAGGASRTRMNNLRLNLLHLHAEREVLKLLLRATARKESKPDSAFERYLARAHRLLLQGVRFGNEQAALKAAFASYDAFNAADTAALLAVLAERAQTLTRAQEIVAELQRVAPGLSVNIVEGGATVSNVTIGTATGQVNIDSTINAPTTIVQGMEPGKLKSELEQLLVLTDRLAQRLPDDQRQRVVDSTASVTRAASSGDKEALKVSAKGLLEAANAVADMAKPIATAVTAVLGIFGLVL